MTRMQKYRERADQLCEAVELFPGYFRRNAKKQGQEIADHFNINLRTVQRLKQLFVFNFDMGRNLKQKDIIESIDEMNELRHVD